MQLLNQDSMGPQSLANSLWALGVFQTTSNPTFRRCLERLGSVDIALISAKQLHQLFQVSCRLAQPRPVKAGGFFVMVAGLAPGDMAIVAAQHGWPGSHTAILSVN